MTLYLMPQYRMRKKKMTYTSCPSSVEDIEEDYVDIQGVLDE
jgi:hypothetical protein